MGLEAWGLDVGDLGCGTPGTTEAGDIGLSPAGVLLYCVQCMARRWGQKSRPGLSGGKAPCAALPFGEGP